MTIEQLVLSIFATLVSAGVGGTTVWLAVRKRLEDADLARASRRTSAMQLLSDEEFAVEQVRDECVAIKSLIVLAKDKLGEHEDHLLREADRIIAESSGMLDELRVRREALRGMLDGISVVELESVIATAYHGRRKAEAQLARTRLTRTDVLKAYGVYDR